MNQVVKNIIKGIIFALPVIALIVPKDMFFPFITGRAFIFRVAVEFSFFLYLALAFADTRYRPKRNMLTISFCFFVVVMFIADLFAVNPFKAFWSNFERMEGFVTLVHLFVYFIVASSILKEKRDWHIWLFSTTAVAFFITLFSFLQLMRGAAINQGDVRVDGDLGNAAYLGAYLVFHIFFILYLWISEGNRTKGISESVAVGGLGYTIYYLWRISHPETAFTPAGVWIASVAVVISLLALWFRFSNKTSLKNIAAGCLYGLVLAGQVVIIYFTATRGAVLGLIGGILIASLYLFLKEKENLKIKKGGLVVFLSVVVIIVGFMAVKNTSFVQNNPVLSRFASISWSESKTQARGYIWPMALRGFMEHPILGWGQEGFNYVFQKHYVPEMITQEPWFDRAHNSFLDWLVAGGILGFLGYILLYISAFVILWKNSVFSQKERALLFGLLAAYSFQSLFIFDNLISYLLFVSVLALVSGEAKESAVSDANKEREKHIGVPLLMTSVVLFTIVLFLVNWKAYAQNIAIIKAETPQPEGVEKNLELFQKAISYGSLGTVEAREQLEQISFLILAAPNATDEMKVTFVRATIDQLEKQKEQTPYDLRSQFNLGYYYRNLGLYENTIKVLEKARLLSPKKQQVAFTLASAYIALGQERNDAAAMEKGLNILKETYNDAPQFDQVKIAYAGGLLVSGKINETVTILKMVNNPNGFINNDIFQKLVEGNYTDDAIGFLEKAIQIEPLNPNSYTTLSNVYVALKNKDMAVKSLERLLAVMPSMKEKVNSDIKAIEEYFKR
ncbi:MAG TPA: O-antigen ligase family protein [Candidatus Paceibacterota bacterium]